MTTARVTKPHLSFSSVRIHNNQSLLDCLYKVGLLQRTYWLEPAGSHGVWSLDDYQMLVFYFGACQLHGNDSFDPKCICDKRLMEEEAGEYMYFEAIHYINTVGNGSCR